MWEMGYEGLLGIGLFGPVSGGKLGFLYWLIGLGTRSWVQLGRPGLRHFGPTKKDSNVIKIEIK